MKLVPDKRFLLRIPADLHERLKEAAARQGVSLNQYCVNALGSDEPAPVPAPVPAQAAAEARRARSATLAADHLARAEARLLALDVLFEAESWADVVRESQEVVELALRGLLRWAGLDGPATGQDVAAAVIRAGKRLPAALAPELPRLADDARRLRRDRDLAFLGSDDVTPWEFYRRDDAEPARDAARRTLALVRAQVLGA